jgi:conjugal transfer pilus assembly protein TraK
MRVRMLFNLIIWSSLVFADEPPELPFRPLDESMKAVKTDTKLVDNANQATEQDFVKQNQVTPSVTTSASAQDAPGQRLKSKKKSLSTERKLESTSKTMKSQEAGISFQSGVTIKPRPGRTENAVIAKDRLNPIVTPFANPKVLTVDPFETRIEGAIVYVSTSSDMPISMFISDEDSPQGSAAISLQLTPQVLDAPVEIRIEAPTSTGLGASLPKGEAMFRHDSPYVAEIKAIMQSLGKQQIPQGFTMEDTVRDFNMASVCQDSNLTFMPGQLLSGHEAKVLVMVAQNNGLTPSVFEETRCAGENVMAVAAWPKVRLEPGEKTEIFILMRLPQGKSGEEFRPALL